MTKWKSFLMKHSATIEMKFQAGDIKDHPAWQHFHKNVFKAFPCDILEEGFFDEGGKLNPDSEMWHDVNYVYYLRLSVKSSRSLSNLTSLCAIFHHWAILWGGSFQIESIRSTSPEESS